MRNIQLIWELNDTTTNQGNFTNQHACAQYRCVQFYKKKNLPVVKQQINSNTAILGNFNTSFLLIWKSSRQNMDRETLELNEITNQMDLIDP